jgi:hypothetical protein
MTEAQAEFAQARLNYDPAAAAEASRRMADVRVRAKEYDYMAREHINAMAAAPKPNRYGLTADQQEAARLIGVDEETYPQGNIHLRGLMAPVAANARAPPNSANATSNT